MRNMYTIIPVASVLFRVLRLLKNPTFPGTFLALPFARRGDIQKINSKFSIDF